MPEGRKRVTEIMTTGALQMGELTGTAMIQSFSGLEDTSNKLMGLVGGETMRSFESRRTRCYIEDDFPMRSRLEDFIEGSLFKSMLSVSIIMSLVLLVRETDMRSEQRTDFFEENGHTRGFHFQSTTEFDYMSFGVSGFFTIDLVCRIFVFRMDYFSSRSNIFDFCVVTTDLIVLGLTPFQDLPSVSVLRVLRMFRIVRFLRSFLIFRELYLMMQGLATALRSIVFATFLIAIVLILWSILAVEFVHIPNMTLHIGDDPLYENCPAWLCEHAFNNVWHASLTFLKTIVAGDGWGQLAYPLITQRPTTAFVLLGSLCMIQLGLLNLIVAVIVDRARCARESDEALVSTEKKQQLNASYRRLQGLFCMMDEDGSGALGLDELHASYFKFAEFREVLDALDVRQKDLDLIFEIIDHDKDGTASYEEFVQTLHEMKEINTSTMLVCIRHYVQKIEKSVASTQQRLGAYEMGMRGMQRYMSAVNEKLFNLTDISKELKEVLTKGKRPIHQGAGADAPESEARPESQEHTAPIKGETGDAAGQESDEASAGGDQPGTGSMDRQSSQASQAYHLQPVDRPHASRTTALSTTLAEVAAQVSPGSSQAFPQAAPSTCQAGMFFQSVSMNSRMSLPSPDAVQAGIQGQALQEAFAEAMEKRIEVLKPGFAKRLHEAARDIAQSVVQASISAMDEGLRQVLGSAAVHLAPSSGINMAWPSEDRLGWASLLKGTPSEREGGDDDDDGNTPAFRRLSTQRNPTQPKGFAMDAPVVWQVYEAAPESPKL